MKYLLSAAIVAAGMTTASAHYLCPPGVRAGDVRCIWINDPPGTRGHFLCPPGAGEGDVRCVWIRG